MENKGPGGKKYGAIIFIPKFNVPSVLKDLKLQGVETSIGT